MTDHRRSHPGRGAGRLAAGAWSLAVLALAPVAAAAPAAPEPLLRGDFPMAGRVTLARHVRGEHRGQVVLRAWRFATGCAGPGPCPTVVLVRSRAAGVDRVALRWVGGQRFTGSGRFWVPVACAGRRFPRGGEAVFTITVDAVGLASEQGIPFATAIVARYASSRRINHTRCAGFLGRDAARYRGALASGPPPPPAAAFTAAQSSPPGLGVAFADRSTVAAAGAPIVARRWDFGDPASGPADSASDQNPAHTFSAPGTYTVTLEVTDADGLSSSSSQTITVV